jgi:abortive infection bacteriophage resistance protein
MFSPLFDRHVFHRLVSTVTYKRLNFVQFLQGLTFNDVIQRSVFVSDQREVVVGVIRRIEPNFEPDNISVDMCYSCNLLHELNFQNQIGEVSCM